MASLAENTTGDVIAGESAAAVTNKLGKPSGTIQLGRRTVYLYDRGMIDVQNGTVVRSDLVSPEEAARLKRERARAEEESRRRAEQERQRLEKEGQAERQRMQADETFQRLPPSERIERWKTFAQKYPHTPVQDEIASALSESDSQQRARDRDQHLARLKSRLQDIEARFKQLDADYAASLANWKRNEIDAERATLTQEYVADQARMVELLGGNATTPSASSTSHSGAGTASP